MEIDKAVIGNKIRNLRKSKNWSQKEFALKIGLTQSSITEIEKGKKLASMNKIYKILVVFDISFDYLFEDVLIAFQSFEKEDLFYNTFRNMLNTMPLNNLEILSELIYEFLIYNHSEKDS